MIDPDNPTGIRLKIPGIKCNRCVERIKKYLNENHRNIINFDTDNPIEANLEEKILTFKMADSNFSPLKLKDIIDSIDEKFSSLIVGPLNKNCQSQIDSATNTLLNENDFIVDFEKKSKINEKQKKQKCYIEIQGMSCSSCVDKIENKLNKTNGIISSHIGLITARAEIDFDPELITPDRIVTIVDDMGYDVSLISVIDSNQQTELHLDIMGVTNNSDVELIKKTMQDLIGVSSININRETGRSKIVYHSNAIGPRKIVDKITHLGFTVHTINSFDPEKFTEGLRKEVKKWRNSFLISLIFGVPTIILMIYFMYIMPWFYSPEELPNSCCVIPGLNIENLLLFLLATPVQIFGARYFYIQAFKSLRNHHLNMDVLIMLATTIAYVYSVFVLLYFIVTMQQKSPMTFFDTPPMLLLFISFGRWLEHLNRLQTTEYIVNLMSLRPTKATLLEVEQRKSVQSITKELIIKSERTIDIDLVEKDDYIRVRPGERIPTDGRMMVGEALVDESFINGESMPVCKKPGSLLLGGSIVSNGSVIMMATNVGADSQLCQIVKMVENAQTTKAPIQQFADRISSYFIPFVILTSLFSFIVWLFIGSTFFRFIFSLNPQFYQTMTHTEIIIQFAFQIGLSVMIISCPCALGIATPSAVIIGTGIGAINGIHIKGAESLEQAQNLDIIIFDKTGTLTHGKPSVTNVKLTEYFSQTTFSDCVKKLIILIGIAEANSDHPIALSVTKYVRRILKLDDDASFVQITNKFKLEAGLGIECLIERVHLETLVSLVDSNSNFTTAWFCENNISYASYIDAQTTNNACKKLDNSFFQCSEFKVTIGNLRWMKNNGVELNNDLQQENERLEMLGETVFNVAINGKIVCLISVSDTVKPEALLAIYTLQKFYGLEVMLLTGDNVRSAMSIGRQVGIHHIYAELLPQHKMNKIKNLQASGMRVAMVGDGINDAPALAQADLGIAIAKGTDITIESANIVITKDDLFDIISCIDLSKKTMQRIRINFLLAFVYNLIFIPIAAGIFIRFGLILQPWMSGACMALSSLSVSCSSLLLRRYNKPKRSDFETTDYLQYKNSLQNKENFSFTKSRSIESINFDQLSLHNPYNLLQPGVNKVSSLNKSNVERRFSMESNDESDRESVQLIKLNKKEIIEISPLSTKSQSKNIDGTLIV